MAAGQVIVQHHPRGERLAELIGSTTDRIESVAAGGKTRVTQAIDAVALSAEVAPLQAIARDIAESAVSHLRSAQRYVTAQVVAAGVSQEANYRWQARVAMTLLSDCVDQAGCRHPPIVDIIEQSSADFNAMEARAEDETKQPLLEACLKRHAETRQAFDAFRKKAVATVQAGWFAPITNLQPSRGQQAAASIRALEPPSIFGRKSVWRARVSGLQPASGRREALTEIDGVERGSVDGAQRKEQPRANGRRAAAAIEGQAEPSAKPAQQAAAVESLIVVPEEAKESAGITEEEKSILQQIVTELRRQEALLRVNINNSLKALEQKTAMPSLRKDLDQVDKLLMLSQAALALSPGKSAVASICARIKEVYDRTRRMEKHTHGQKDVAKEREERRRPTCEVAYLEGIRKDPATPLEKDHPTEKQVTDVSDAVWQGEVAAHWSGRTQAKIANAVAKARALAVSKGFSFASAAKAAGPAPKPVAAQPAKAATPAQPAKAASPSKTPKAAAPAKTPKAATPAKTPKAAAAAKAPKPAVPASTPKASKAGQPPASKVSVDNKDDAVKPAAASLKRKAASPLERPKPRGRSTGG